MESLAQKKAKANFKKAIAYRKKTGCSLKEAFAHVQGKKVGAVKKRSSSPLKKKVAKNKVSGYVKTLKKDGITDVIYSYPVKHKKATQQKLFGTKRASKPSEKTILNKIHKAKKDIDQLDEAQHKHMSIGSFKNEIINKLKHSNSEIMNYEGRLKRLQARLPKLDKVQKIIARDFIKSFKEIIKEEKAHQRELKKQI